jgi:hypothetical protein
MQVLLSQAKYELQTTVLNENLTTIRGDLVTTQNQVEDLSKSNDELRGEKLGRLLSLYFVEEKN